MVLDTIAKVLTSAQGSLSSIVAILSLFAGIFPHFNWNLTHRLQKEASRLDEINKACPYRESCSDSSAGGGQDKCISPAEEIAYSTSRNHISEKIYWLLFASQTNDLQTKKEDWGISCPPPYIALMAAILAVFPAAAVATMAKEPNNTRASLIAYVFAFGGLAIVLLFSALNWWAIRKDFFRKNLHCYFTGFRTESGIEAEEALSKAVDGFEKEYTDESYIKKSLLAWIEAIAFGIAFAFVFYTGNLLWLFLIVVPILCLSISGWIKRCIKSHRETVVELLNKFVNFIL